MLPYRKKLIEVALPLAAINAESAREKSIRHGHPSTLHLWWARRPLAACRAVLFSSLVDDPDSDPQYRNPDGTLDEERAGIKRADLFNLIEELVMWENSNNIDVIRTARAEIARCVASRLIETGVLKKDTVIGEKTTVHQLVTRGHCRPMPLGLDKKVGRVRFSFDVSGLPPADAVNAFLAEHAPPVLDPFAGGGSIPLEAQRLGLRAYASDLNPVPVLINKALIEIPPKFAGRPPVNPVSREGGATSKGKGKKSKKLMDHDWPGATGLAEDVRYYGQWMRDEAEKRIGHLYPKVEVTAEMAKDRPDLLPYVGQQLTVIAWLWARTVISPNPACNGARVPLVRSFWLATKKTRKTCVAPVVSSDSTSYQFVVRVEVDEAPPGTVNRNGATCILSGAPIPLDYVRAEGKAGRLGVKMLAIVCEGKSERVYFSPTKTHEAAARVRLSDDIPDTEMPEAALGFRVQNYGMVKHRHLFTDRQMVAMTTFCDLIKEVRHLLVDDASRNTDYAGAVATFLALGVGRCADFWNTMATWSWQPKNELVGHAFGRQALPITWDFGEINPFSDSGGNFSGNLEFTVKALERTPASGIGIVSQCDALAVGGDGYCLSTDPPYYDNVPYADLSDFFYIWLRRSLIDVYPDVLRTVLAPKTAELVACPFRHGGKENARNFFETGMRRFFEVMRGRCDTSVPATIYYAFKQSEDENEDETNSEDVTAADGETTRSSTGWETFLQGLADTRWGIVGTWPVRTERSGRLRDNASNALASSIVLVPTMHRWRRVKNSSRHSAASCPKRLGTCNGGTSRRSTSRRRRLDRGWLSSLAMPRCSRVTARR